MFLTHLGTLNHIFPFGKLIKQVYIVLKLFVPIIQLCLISEARHWIKEEGKRRSLIFNLVEVFSCFSLTSEEGSFETNCAS